MLEDRFKRLNLTQYFVVSSIGVFIVLTIVLGIVFIHHQKRLLIDYAIASASEFAHQLSHSILDQHIGNVLSSETGIDFVQGSEEFSKLDSMISSYVSEYSDTIRIKIFNRRGLTVYSTNPENIGLINTSEKLISALAGNVSSKLTRRSRPIRGDNTEGGSIYPFDILEIYVPIYERDNGVDHRGRVIGAFEIYKDVSIAFNQARTGGYVIFILFISGMAALYLMLQLIIRRADRIIKKQNAEIDIYNRELEAAQAVISKSIDEVIEHESFHVRYENNDLLKCWEHKNCVRKDCPAYESDDVRCWQIAGTFCGKEVKGYFANKYGDCRKCDVYKHAFSNRISRIGESFNNMMTLLQNKHYQLKELNDRLNWLIDIDPLTQIGNRRSFQKRIEKTHMMSIRYRRAYSVIIGDIDSFKLYNDTYGHQHGDYALVTVAKVLKDNLRQTDEIFRWGGEEFVIILPEQNLDRALKVAEHLRISIQSIAIEHRMSEFQIITMSFGVAASFSDNVKHMSWESIIKEADDQLYKAKAAGKNKVYPLSAQGGEGTA